MENSMLMSTSFFFYQKYSFGANLVPKLKLIVYGEIWCLVYFEYVEFTGDVYFIFFYFQLKRLFLGKSGPKNQNCKFNLKFLIHRLIQICKIQ